MTDRAAVVAKIGELAEELAAVDPADLDPAKPLFGQGGIDSLDIVEIVMALEEEYPALCQPDWRLDVERDWTIDRIADAVLAQLAKQEGAATNT